MSFAANAYQILRVGNVSAEYRGNHDKKSYGKAHERWMTDSETLLLCLSFGRNGGYVRQICLACVAPLFLSVFFSCLFAFYFSIPILSLFLPSI